MICVVHSHNTFVTIIASLPKVIWEEGRVAALSHTNAVKPPLVTMECPKFAPQNTPSRGPIPKPASSLDPSDLWCQTAFGSDPPFFRNALDRPTDARMYRPTERSWEKFDDYRPLRYDSDAAGPREGVLLGANLGHATVTNGDFTAYVFDSAATRPSSQITLGRLIIIRPRRSRSAAAYSHQTFPCTICWSVCLSVQCIVEKRQIAAGSRSAPYVGRVHG